MNDRGVRAMLRPLANRLAMLAARAVVRLVSDTSGRQRLQLEILKGELRDGVERAQDYGFTSHPHTGADAILIALGGAREQAVVLAVDDRRYRLQLQPGEVALYDDLGNCVKLLRTKVHVVGVDEVHAQAPTVRLEATDVIIAGDVAITGTVTCNGKRIDDTHTHGGVQTGSGNTAPPN